MQRLFVKNTSFLIFVAVFFHYLFTACHAQHPEQEEIIPPKYEFRGVWIATIANIDWPSRRDLSSDEQKKEFRELLDFHKNAGINAVFVQIRASGDAFYAKSKEPWSEWLTGRQGKAPEPFYDPLEFMIQEAHNRGMEFHAWLNLNRVVHKTIGRVSPDNIGLKHPEWVLSFDGYKIFNFGIPEVRQFITDMAVDIARDYDVDGIHFDDYFYPYPVPGQKLNDEESFRKYGKNFSRKEEWRRHNIDELIYGISKGLEMVKPSVKFGISPFGVWRNKGVDSEGSATVGGLASYDDLYADVRKWLKENWIDYVVPQVYFSEKFRKVPYQNLVNWWMENTYGRHLYIGQAAYRASNLDPDPYWHNPKELINQISYNRQHEMMGSVFFSSRSLKTNNFGITDTLKSKFYNYPALVPPMPWKDNIPPSNPRSLKASLNEEGVNLFWREPEEASDGETATYYVVYRFKPGEKTGSRDPRKIVGIIRNKELKFIDKNISLGDRFAYYVTAVDRLNNESRPVGPLRIEVGDKKLIQFK